MSAQRRPAPAPSARRVWLLNQYASTPENAGGVRHHSLAKAVVHRGGDATVFAAGLTAGRGDLGRVRGGLVRDRWVGGVRFTWVRTLGYRGNTWRRVANMLSYCLMVALAEVGRPAPDVVVGSTVHPFAAFTGWYVARRRGARFIYEVRDLWPQTMIDVGEMRATSFAARGLYALEAFLTRHADTVLTVLPGMADYLASRGLPTGHVVYLPNGPDLADFDAAARDRRSDRSFDELLADLEARRRAGEVVFVYAGSHGLVNRLDVIVDAASLLHERGVPVHVLFVGDGPEKPALARTVKERGMTFVRFVDAIPKARIPRLLAAADVGLLHYTRTAVYAYGISFNKLFDYMAARLPAIFACESVNDPIAASGGGLSVAPDDASALAEAMAALVELGPAERRRLGAAGRAWVEEHHDMGRLSERFLEVVGMGAGGELRELPVTPAKVA